jgi:hypothetical protein
MNSIPKAGTNLLERALMNFPYLRRRLIPTVNGWNNLDAETLAAIQNLGNGEFVAAHLPFNEQLAHLMSESDIKMILMIRDPRDILISYCKYVTEIDYTHRDHNYYKNLLDDDARLMAAIKGVDGITSPIDEVLEKFKPWLNMRGVLVIRFEDLVGAQGGGDNELQYLTIQRISRFLNTPMDDKTIQDICARIYHEKALTFRKSQIGNWRNVYKQQHIFEFTRRAGSYLELYGYK